MPKPLEQQTVVITGASSGFGREAAVLFGRRGANVVLAARDGEALREVAREVEAAGGRARAVPTDVAEWDQVRRLAEAAVARFGGIDTWVNNAGVSLGGLVEDCEVEEIERLIRVNFLGQIHGVKAAWPHMKARKQGAFINVGSIAGTRTFPLQTVYSASKAGVRGFTEGLRLELRREPGEFHVTYIAPGSIDTPIFPDSRSKFGTQLRPPRPVYDATTVAESIVFAAEHPRRDILVGGGAKMFEVLQRISPSFVDWFIGFRDAGIKEQTSDRPSGPDNLFTPPPGPRRVDGDYPERRYATSLYTKVFEHRPLLKPIAVGALAVGAVALIRASARPRRA
jgi:short-subunit dehydrogenase